MSVRSRFTDEELAAIRDAAATAEKGTAAEVVAVVVDRCDAYADALWKAAAIGALGGALAAAAWHTVAGLWGGWPILWIAGPAMAGAGVLAPIAALAPAVRRGLIGKETLTRRVRSRATVAFLDEGVSKTRDRTGVLVLVALFERRVEIIADEGLRGRVAPETWETIAGDLATALHEGRPGPAVAAAITACGRTLAGADLPARADDADELRNEPRLRDA